MKKRKTFRTKLMLYFMLFAALILSLLWLLQTVFLQSFYNEMLIGNTRRAAESIAEKAECSEINDIIDTATISNSILVFVTDESGNILYTSDEYRGAHQKGKTDNANEQNEKMHGKHMGAYRELPEEYNNFSDILSEEDGEAEYTTDKIYTYVKKITYGENKTPSILYVSTTLDAVGSAVTIIRVQLAIVTILSLGAAFVLAWFIARRFSLPVAQLYEKANKLGEGDYPKDFNKGFCAELDDLSFKLDKTSDKLIESRNFQTELLANVSHDLRTPLTMIKGYAEMIKDTSWDDEEQCAADIAVIVRETDRLTNLVNEILEYSELKTRGITEIFDEIDLTAVIEKACANYSDLSRQRGETIEVHTQNNIIVRGSAQRIERAVYNLIDNAFRHADDKTVTVDLTKNGDNARIEVIDRGKGIPKEECEHIFDRYYTFRKRGGRGVSGLGLAIVKQTAEMHGGTCFCDSTEGKGSTFGIELPLTEH